MNDETAVKGASGYFARLRRTRVATRLSVIVERGWPLLLPLVIVASLFLSLSWLGVFSRAAGFGAHRPRSRHSAWRRWPRSIRCASSAARSRRGRPPHRGANLLARPRAGPDGPAGRRAAAFGQALWREHQKRMAARLDGVGADLPRTAVPERDPWALRAVAALLLVTAFAFPGPEGGSIGDRFKARIAAGTMPAAHRCLGDAAGLYRQAADLPDRRVNRRPPAFYTVPEGSEVSLRVTGGSRRGNARLCRRGGQRPRHRPAEKRRPGDAKPAAAQRAVQGAPVRRQADGRRHADAEVGRGPDSPAGPSPSSRTSRRRSASSASRSAPPTAPSSSTTRSTTIMAPPPPRRCSRWPIRRRPTRIRSTRRPKCRWRCRAAAARRTPPRPRKRPDRACLGRQQIKLTLVATDDAGQTATQRDQDARDAASGRSPIRWRGR